MLHQKNVVNLTLAVQMRSPEVQSSITQSLTWCTRGRRRQREPQVAWRETAMSEVQGDLVDAGDEPRSAPAISVIFVTELQAQQVLLGPNAREERRDGECREEHSEARTKGQSPSQHQDDHPKVTRVTDDPIDAVGDQLMLGLDGHQSAEPAAENEDGPDPQRATRQIEENSKPANSFAVENPPPLSLCVGRQERAQEANDQERHEDPTIGTILAFA